MLLRVLFCTAVGLAAPSDARFYLATRSMPDYVERDARGTALWGVVQSFYRARDYRLAWMDDGRRSAEAEAIARVVARAAEEGLDGGRYRIDLAPHAVAAAFNGAPASDADAVQDVQLTYIFLKYAADLTGRFDPKAAGPFWLTQPRSRDLSAWLEQCLQSQQALEAFAALSPSHPVYEGLKAALARYRRIERDGGWSVLPSRLALRRGRRDPVVALLRRRLAAEDDLVTTLAATSVVYDARLADADEASQADFNSPDDTAWRRTELSMGRPLRS